MTAVQASLSSLIKDFWQWRLEDSPEFATTLGIHDKDDLLDELSVAAYDRRYERCCSFSRELSSLETSGFSSDDRINYQLFKSNLDSFVDGYKWRRFSIYNCVNFLENTLLTFTSVLIDAMMFEQKEDFDKYVNRLSAIPTQIQQQIELMRESMRLEVTLHSVSIEGTIEQLEKFLTTADNDNLLFAPFVEKLPSASIDESMKNELKTKALEVVRNEVKPACKSLVDFLRNEYKTRPGLGVATIENGADFYADCLKWHTSTDLLPDTVHQMGLDEVDRIRKNMENVRDSVGFDGSLKEFFSHLKDGRNPEFYHKNEEDLLAEFQSMIADVIPPLLVDYFSNIPDNQCVVKRMPYNGPGGMYIAPPMDASKPGIFYANLHEPETKPRFCMMSLSLHEASPGHHFQHVYLHKQKIPEFRKLVDHSRYYSAPSMFPLFTAYCEGWALYTEFLGEEMKAYRTPYELLGRYSDEMFRAARLVVDTGLHVRGWSLERAADFLRDNTCVPEVEIVEEVKRYVTWPGQACAYKIGELKVKELRKKAEAALGDAFDIKDFHSAVLNIGNVPLSMLEEAVNDMIDTLRG